LLLAGLVDERLQRRGGLRVERDAAFGVPLPNRDPQPGMSVGVGIQTVHGQAADLVAAGASPAGHDQRGPLVGIGQLVHGGHQRGEFVVGDEPRQRFGDLGDVTAGEQDPGGDVVPAPGGSLGNEPGDQGDDGPPVAGAERDTSLVVGSGAEPPQELLGVLTVQVGEAGHLRVRLTHPTRQAA